MRIYRGFHPAATLLISVLLVCGACSSPAEEPESSPKEAEERLSQNRPSVNDMEEILTEEQEAALTTKIRSVEVSKDVQIAVVTMADIPDDVEAVQYAAMLGNEWEIGTEDGNGVIILLSKARGKTAIAVGRKVEEVYNNEVTGEIIRKEMLPFFRTGYYQQGLMNALNAMARVEHAPTGS